MALEKISRAASILLLCSLFLALFSGAASAVNWCATLGSPNCANLNKVCCTTEGDISYDQCVSADDLCVTSCGAEIPGSGMCNPQGNPTFFGSCSSIEHASCCGMADGCVWDSNGCHMEAGHATATIMCSLLNNKQSGCGAFEDIQVCTWSQTQCAQSSQLCGASSPLSLPCCQGAGSCIQSAGTWKCSCPGVGGDCSSNACCSGLTCQSSNNLCCYSTGGACTAGGGECCSSSVCDAGTCKSCSGTACVAASDCCAGYACELKGAGKQCCIADNSATQCNYGSDCCSGFCSGHACQPAACEVAPTISSYTDVTLAPAYGKINTFTYNISEKDYVKTGVPNALLFMVNLSDQSNITICYQVTDSTGHSSLAYDPSLPGCTDYWFIFCPDGKGTQDDADGLAAREKCLLSTKIDYGTLIYPVPTACEGSPPAPKSYLDHILSHNELYFCNKVTKDYAPLCWPLMLILGLLLGASFAAGKNPFQAFDFSSPRMNRGRQYSMRVQNKSFDLMSYLMSVGSIAAGSIKGKTKAEKAKMAAAKAKVKEAKKKGEGVKAARQGVSDARQGIRTDRKEARQEARQNKYDSSEHKTRMGRFLHNIGAFVGVRDKKHAAFMEQKKGLLGSPKSTLPKDAFSEDAGSQRSTSTSSTAQVNMVVSPRQVRQAKRASIAALNAKINAKGTTPAQKKELIRERLALRLDQITRNPGGGEKSTAQVRQVTRGTDGAQAATMMAVDTISTVLSFTRRGVWSKEGMASRMKDTGVDAFFREATGANTRGQALVILLRFVLKKMMENAKLRDKETEAKYGSKIRTNLSFTSPIKVIVSLFRIYAVMSSLSSYVKGLGAATGSKSLSGGIGFIEGINSVNIGGIGKYNIDIAELATWVDPSLRGTYVGAGSSMLPYPLSLVQTAVSGTLVGTEVLVQKAGDALRRDVKLAFVLGDEAFIAKVDRSGNFVDMNGKDVMKENGSGQPVAYKKINVKTGETTDCTEVIDLSRTTRAYVVVKGSNTQQESYSVMGEGAAKFYDNSQRDRAETYLHSNSFVYGLKSQYGGSQTKTDLIQNKMNAFEVASRIPDLSSLDGNEAAKYIALRNACDDQVKLVNTFLGVINGKEGMAFAFNVIKQNQDKAKISEALDFLKKSLKPYESTETGKLTDEDKRKMFELEDKISSHELALIVFDSMEGIDISKETFDAANKAIERNMDIIIGVTNSYLNCYSQAIATGIEGELIGISKLRGQGLQGLEQNTGLLNRMAAAMSNYNAVRFNSAKAESEYLSGLRNMVDAGSNMMVNGSVENLTAFAQATENLCETMIKGVSFEGRFGNKEKDLLKNYNITSSVLKSITEAPSESYNYKYYEDVVEDKTGKPVKDLFGGTVTKPAHATIDHSEAINICTTNLFNIMNTTIALHQTSDAYLNSKMAESGWQGRPAYQVSPEGDALNRIPAPTEASGERDLARGFYSPSFNLNSISNVKYGPTAKFKLEPADYTITPIGEAANNSLGQ